VSRVHELITALYDALNARDIEGVTDRFAAGVDWPDAWAGGRVVGRDAVRGYLLRQWAEIGPDVRLRLVRELPDGRYEALVDQVIRDRDGHLLSEAVVLHTYTVQDGLIARMDVGDPLI
jgi:hypothetical protein